MWGKLGTNFWYHKAKPPVTIQCAVLAYSRTTLREYCPSSLPAKVMPWITELAAGIVLKHTQNQNMRHATQSMAQSAKLASIRQMTQQLFMQQKANEKL